MLLETPLSIGSLELPNRLVSAPMERNYCDTEGTVTDLYIDYLKRRAVGGAALVFTEATYVAQEGKSRARQSGLVTDGHEAGIRRLANAVHDGGGLLGIELNHGGRTSQSRASGKWPVAPSPIPLTSPDAEVPHELTITEIEGIVEAFHISAQRAQRAGVDVLSIHGGHGYLIQAFMSPATNRRTDKYADPTLFVGQVIEAVRTGAPELPVGLRVSAFEGNEGGLSAEQQLQIIRDLGDVSVDFLDISAGNYEAPEWSVQPAEFKRGLLAPYAEPYREFGVPVGVAGRISDGITAETILQAGQADFISMARALHADPDFPRRVFNQELYRPCIACNLCVDELGSGEPARCSVNAEVNLPGGEEPVLSSTDPRKILVVGAGPSGLEASCLLAEAGHNVHLVDDHDIIGGQFRLPVEFKGVPEYKRLLAWYEQRLLQAGVQITLSQTVKAEFVQSFGADSVLLATGAHGRDATFDGAEDDLVIDIREWLSREEPAPTNVTIIGGDRQALAVGYELADQGSRVTIVFEEEELGLDVGRRAKILKLPFVESSPLVDLAPETKVTKFDGELLHTSSAKGAGKLPTAGPILTAFGVELKRELLDSLPYDAFVHAQQDGPTDTVVDALCAGRQAARVLLRNG